MSSIEMMDVSKGLKKILKNHKKGENMWHEELKAALSPEALGLFGKGSVTEAVDYYRNKARQTANPDKNTRGNLERVLLQDLKAVLDIWNFERMSSYNSFIKTIVGHFIQDVHNTAIMENAICKDESSVHEKQNEFHELLSNFHQKKTELVEKLIASERLVEIAKGNFSKMYDSFDWTVYSEARKATFEEYAELREYSINQLHTNIQLNLALIESVEPKNLLEMDVAVPGTSGPLEQLDYTMTEMFRNFPELLQQWIEEKAKNKKFASCVTLQAAKLLHSDIQKFLNANWRFMALHKIEFEKYMNYHTLIRAKVNKIVNEGKIVNANTIKVINAGILLESWADVVEGLRMYAAVFWLKEMELTGEDSLLGK